MLHFWDLYGQEFVSFGLALLAGLIFWVFQPRVKLWWTLAHTFVYVIPRNSEKDLAIVTQVLQIQNKGRATAHNVEIVLNWEPTNVSVWPQRLYTRQTNPENRFILKFDTVGAGEFFSINILVYEYHSTPDIITVRSDEARGTEISIITNKKYPPAFYVALAGLLFLGFTTFIYLIIVILKFLTSL